MYARGIPVAPQKGRFASFVARDKGSATAARADGVEIKNIFISLIKGWVKTARKVRSGAAFTTDCIIEKQTIKIKSG